jgi:glycosyltransferase involved in cell wall biosynthesis
LVARPEISVVIPAFNEEDSILPLAQALHDVLITLGRTFEVIFVDDGSTDGTPVKLEQILQLDRRVKVIQLATNAGQTAALCAGFDASQGRFVIAMDGDLQNDPSDIPEIIAELDVGWDIVSGWRRNRKDHISRRLPSICANALLSWISGVKLHDFGCTLKGYRSEFIRRVPLYSDMHRYLPAFATAMGARVKEIEVKHHPRVYGESKYGMGRIYRVAMDIAVLQLLVHFAFRPLHWFGMVSVFVFLLCAGLLLLGFADDSVLGSAGEAQGLEYQEFSTIVFPSIIVLGIYLGTTLLSLGFLCELINRVGDREMDQLYTVDDLETQPT